MAAVMLMPARTSMMAAAIRVIQVRGMSFSSRGRRRWPMSRRKS
jgi:hypothetical protein